MECIFCKIVKGDLPSHKVYDDHYVMAFLDTSPVNPGHVLVVPKRHVNLLDEVDDVMLAHVMVVAKKIGTALKTSLGVKGYNVVINNGEVAGQVINHFHCHVIPRLETDNLHNWPQGQYAVGEAEVVAEKIKQSL